MEDRWPAKNGSVEGLAVGTGHARGRDGETVYGVEGRAGGQATRHSCYTEALAAWAASSAAVMQRFGGCWGSRRHAEQLWCRGYMLAAVVQLRCSSGARLELPQPIRTWKASVGCPNPFHDVGQGHYGHSHSKQSKWAEHNCQNPKNHQQQTPANNPPSAA
eukprot:365617-Chlamydomonas_euryale.AAC.13